MQQQMKQLLQQVASGELSVEDAMLKIKTAPFEELGFAKLDHHRALRQGIGEVIYGAGKTPEQILETILGDFGLEITDTMPTAFQCDCSKERVSRAISTLSKKDLDDIINDGEAIEVKCQFCNTAYQFSVDELKEMRK